MGNSKIGIIGVGNIGSRVAKCLSKHYEIIGYDIVYDKVEKIQCSNIKPVANNREVAEKCDVIFMSLPGPQEVLSTMLGEEGILEQLKDNSTVIDLTTNSPDAIITIGKELDSSGINFIEMPVTGGIMAAETGTLSAFVGGDVGTYKKMKPILDLFSHKRTHYGEFGKASIAKLLNNRIGIQCSFLVIESLIIGAKHSIDPQMLLDSIESGSGGNVQVPRLRDVLFTSDFENGFPSRLAVKDLHLISDVEISAGASRGATTDALKLYMETAESGFEEQDFAVVVKILEQRLQQSLLRGES
jgi:3-hydroxyisobutyrate dehydrogenase